jgi:hypothetical protein
VSTPERAPILPADLLARLSRALDASEPETALRDTLCGCALPEAMTERVVQEALRVRRRARERTPHASSTERELSLGVLLVLCGVLGQAPQTAVEGLP